MAPLTKEDVNIVHETKQILEEGGTFFPKKNIKLKMCVQNLPGLPTLWATFVIGVEILSDAIIHSKEIEGIQIDQTNSIKITHYAYDTTVKDSLVCSRSQVV